MSERELYYKLLGDLNMLSLPVEDVEIKFRPYSKTYYGRYFPSKQQIFLYPYRDKKGNFLEYDKILETVIHEFIHHLQHSDPTFKRRKGVMHNTDFWRKYNHYVNLANSYNMLEAKKYAKII